MGARTIIGVVLVVVAASGCAAPTAPPASTSEPQPVATTEPPPPTTVSTTAITTTTHTATTTVAQREIVALEVRTRESWGAQPPDRELTAHEIEAITLHHTATSLPDTTIEERLRIWQDYHQSLGFGDIAYHFIIDKDGQVFEGRGVGFVGATRTAYDPAGHFLPALDGMFDEFWDSPDDDDDEPDGADELTETQLNGLVDLLAWASVEFGVDPADITGHRDHAATACPGSVVYELIESGEIARLVAERIEAVDFELAYVQE
ncbi:MAG: peptidoglycan recognition family protein [Actinomycetota bacterium]